MLDFALSTVATPHLPISEAIELAERAGFDAIELRSFGLGSTRFACDPALTDEPKTRALIDSSGIDCVGIATGVRFDDPIRPPVVGRVLADNERPIREAKHAIDLAAQIHAPLVRVFGFESHGSESLKQTIKRVAWRLGMACDHARNTGIRVVIENGGAFRTAESIAELIERVNSPHLGACYNAAVGRAAGDDPADAIALLADGLLLARVKDSIDGRPAPLGEGQLAPEEFIGALAETGRSLPVVFEWDAAWFEGLAPAEEVAAPALERLCLWSGQAEPSRISA